jgi:hypothetical protein
VTVRGRAQGLKVRARPARHLPETGKTLEARKVKTNAAKPGDAKSDMSDSTSDEENIVRHAERKRLPARNRRSWAFALWTGMAGRPGERGLLQMTVFMLMWLRSCCRPGQRLGLTRKGLRPPSGGMSKHWSSLLFSEAKQKGGKTVSADVRMPLDTPCLKMLVPFSPEPRRRSSTKVWTTGWPQLTREVGECLKELGITLAIAPYQAKHSKPSVDVAQGLRDLVRVQRRQWRTTQSEQRYERRARLTERWHLLPGKTQALLIRCESHLADVLYGRPHGLALL